MRKNRINLTFITLMMCFAAISVVSTACSKDDDDSLAPGQEQTGGGSGSGSGSNSSDHKYSLDYWQTEYNYLISEITAEFISLDTAKRAGDTVAAKDICNTIKRLQSAAKSVREDAKKDGWTIKQDPMETKSANY